MENKEPAGTSGIVAKKIGPHLLTDKAHLVEGSKTKNPDDLIELAQQIQRCDDSIKAVASSKLRTILEQMRSLQKQAQQCLEEAKRDAELHHAACNFKKIPGKLYYLYKRKSGQTYFSMLSPEEWGVGCPHEFLGCYKLEFDLTWTLFEDLPKREEDNAMIEKLIKQQFNAALTYEPAT
uniref:Uncharacterized protein C1orf50 homolog n=1 Tax=Phallusia mammillata TaxID=59560 RepID=A0A6F9D7F6_9ASCI|nr:uncharacterized protein C1orf50 homolog [Phallusia mammillata]